MRASQFVRSAFVVAIIIKVFQEPFKKVGRHPTRKFAVFPEITDWFDHLGLSMDEPTNQIYFMALIKSGPLLNHVKTMI